MFMFWERAEKLRESLSMTAGELWASIGKSRNTANDWLKFGRIPSGDICVKI